MAENYRANPKEILSRYLRAKQEKYNWNVHYQVLAEYFMTRKADFTVNFQPGTFLNRDLYDSTGPKAANIMAGALLGMLWPEEGKNIEIIPSRNIPQTKINKDYYNEIDQRTWESMTEPRCGLSLALTEYMRDEVNFGTCGVAGFDPSDNYVDEDCHFLFQAWDIKRMVIEEGPNGFVNRVFYEREETIEQCALEFGLENLSEKTRRAYENKTKDLKINILHAIEPRYERDPDGVSVFDLPVSSCYIEMGEDKLIKESGYDRMPVWVGRFMKNIREKYGRCPAMDALPDVLELNALREAEIVATEIKLNPPLGVLDDGRLGAGSVDTSAGGITTFNITGRIGNQPPIFPLFTIGDLKDVKERIEELKQSVADHFMIDRLLDMQNETEMTLGEVMERQKLRAFILNPIFARQINEVFTPMVRHCVLRLFEKGVLGVLPGSREAQLAQMFGEKTLVIPPDVAAALLRGEEVFEIKYLTPAARMLKTQLASGVLMTWKFMNDIAQAQPEVYDNVDEDVSVQLIADFEGAPKQILRDRESVGQIRAARSQQQAADKQFSQKIEAMKAAKGLLPNNAGEAPGVESPSNYGPIAL